MGGVLNTSLNIHGKPLVRSPNDLLNELLIKSEVELSYVLLDDVLLKRSCIN